MKEIIKCIIFDVDGTLLDNTSEIIELFQELQVKYMGPEYRMSKEEVLSLWGPPGDEIFRNVFPSDVVEEAWNEFLAQYREHHTKDGFFSRAQLKSIRNSVQYLTIFTGKSRDTNNISMEVLGIRDCFDLIYTGSDVKKSKPDPEAIFRIINDLKLEKNETIFIGDSHLDIQAGKSAGIYTAAALWGAIETGKLLDSNPDHVFRTPLDFIEFINQK
jgi:HAD superfamily hydrolase (TIGR01549 family)